MSKFNKKVKEAENKSLTKRVVNAIPDKYSHIDFTPPLTVAKNAKRALEVRASKPASQRGMTAVGIARARDLGNRKQVSPDTINRMVAYFTRHEVDKQGSTWEEQGKGWQAWMGWGGDAGFVWARKVQNQMKRADNEMVSLGSIQKYSCVFSEEAILFSEEGLLKDEETGLWIGKPFRTLAKGSVHSRMNGKPLAKELTEQDLSDLVDVYSKTREESPVIIDWNHNSGSIAPMESQVSLGLVKDFKVDGDSIVCYPLYNDKGLELIKANQGVLWSSPEFLLGDVYSRKDGQLVSHVGQLLAITLTNRPAQPHNKIDYVSLSENKLMDYTLEQLQAMPIEELAKLCMEKHQLVLELEQKVKDLQAEIDALMAEEVTEPSEPIEAPSHAQMSETMVMLNEVKAQNLQLSERLKALEIEKHNLERENAISMLLSEGKITPAEKDLASKAFDLKVKGDATFFNMFSERAANKAVPLQTIGTAVKPQQIDVVDAVKTLAKEKGIGFNEALDIFKIQHRDAYIAYSNGR